MNHVLSIEILHRYVDIQVTAVIVRSGQTWHILC